MAWRDSDGYCFFVGRNDDVIKCSGYRIGPFEVESALHRRIRPCVECAVTAAPDPIRGKVVEGRPSLLAQGFAEPADELVEGAAGPREAHDRALQVPARGRATSRSCPRPSRGKIKRKLIRTRDGIED